MFETKEMTGETVLTEGCCEANGIQRHLVFSIQSLRWVMSEPAGNHSSSWPDGAFFMHFSHLGTFADYTVFGKQKNSA